MDRHDGFCPGSNSSSYLRGIDIERVRLDIHVHGFRAEEGDRFCCRNECKWSGNDFIPRSDAESHHGNLESVRSRGASRRISNSEVTRDLAFELPHLLTQDELS